MFFVAGVFRLTMMPVTRAIVFELNWILKGKLKQYVDDGIVVSPLGHVNSGEKREKRMSFLKAS